MRRPHAAQGGAALIELAFVVPAFFMLLALAVFYGEVLHNYAAVQNAAQQATRYLAGAPGINMGSKSQARYEVAVAQAIFDANLGQLAGQSEPPYLIVECDGWGCLGDKLPDTVSVRLQFVNYPELFYDFAPEMTSVPLQTSSTMRYVGK